MTTPPEPEEDDDIDECRFDNIDALIIAIIAVGLIFLGVLGYFIFF